LQPGANHIKLSAPILLHTNRAIFEQELPSYWLSENINNILPIIKLATEVKNGLVELIPIAKSFC
jgi:hypothetical protein